MSQAVGQTSEHVLVDVLDDVQDGMDGGEKRVSVAEIVASLNDRGFGALCAFIGALAATPLIGALPGVSIGSAVLVLLIAGQHVAGRRSPWIPSTLAKRSFERATVDKSVDKVRPYAKWLDGLIRPRLGWFIDGDTKRRLIGLAMCVLALIMFPLALIPWGVLPPALAIAAFGIAIMGRDGLFALVGYALVAVTLYVLYAFWGVIESFL